MVEPVDPRRGRGEPSDEATGPRRGQPPVLPSTTSDETAEGWGERADAPSDDERFLRERPPHHEG